jgi:type I restriction enzyme R subunit
VKILSQYEEKQHQFLEFVLSQYVQVGESELDSDKLPELLQLQYGSSADAVRELGTVAEIRSTFRGFQKGLYDE